VEDLPINWEKDWNINVGNTREIFHALTSNLRKDAIQKRGNCVINTYRKAYEEGISYYWYAGLTQNEKELLLRGFSSARFNAGSEPQEIIVERNDFTGEELDTIFNNNS